MSETPYYYFVADEGYVRVLSDRWNRPLPFTVLKSKLAKRFSALGLIKKDLDLVKENLRLLQEGVDNKIIKQSLSFFAVVTYAKCFAQAEGRGVKLDITAIKDIPDAVREEHERLLKQRNQYVAHGGGEGWEQNAVVVALDTERQQVDRIYPNIIFLNDIDSQLEHFWLLVALIDDYVTAQLKATFKKLREEVLAMPYALLSETAISPKVNDLQRFH